MVHVWTWGGVYFGYFEGEDLWTYDGRHVGKKNGDEIYGASGRYLGEVMNNDRLITHRSKSNYRGYSFSPWGRRVGIVPFINYVGYVMYAGYQDFPAPNKI